MSHLKGKTAFVTGGSRGIGAAIVRRLVADGASVAFTYARSAARAEQLLSDIEHRQAGSDTAKATTATALALHVDNADPEAVQDAISHVAGQWGHLDILVNNAGIFEVKPTGAFTLDDYERQMGINARAVFAAIQRASHIMQDGGSIINIGSNLADRVPGEGLSLYAMSKAAVWGLTKGAARDLGPRGITVNIIQPGSTDTDMNPADGPASDRQRGLRAVPRYNKPEEIAAMVSYLASDAARSVTGASLLIDGGANI